MYSTESQDRKRKYLEITMHLALGEESSYSNQLLGYHRKINWEGERERQRIRRECFIMSKLKLFVGGCMMLMLL